jgi:glutamine amidotransferase
LRSEEAAHRPVVVLASEPMDDDLGWRALESGQLLHIDDELGVDVQPILPDPPAHPLSLSDLSEHGRTSQSTAR